MWCLRNKHIGVLRKLTVETQTCYKSSMFTGIPAMIWRAGTTLLHWDSYRRLSQVLETLGRASSCFLEHTDHSLWYIAEREGWGQANRGTILSLFALIYLSTPHLTGTKVTNGIAVKAEPQAQAQARIRKSAFPAAGPRFVTEGGFCFPLTHTYIV